MAVSETIEELLQGIDDAQYGRDMRDYIHKGIQKCYEEGSAGETDLQARTDIQTILGNFATVESSTTAVGSYAIGDCLVLDKILYVATAAIEAGDTLTVGTNIEATTVGDVLEKRINPPDPFRAAYIMGSLISNESETVTSTGGWFQARIQGDQSNSAAYVRIADSHGVSDIDGVIAYAKDESLGASEIITTPWVYVPEGTQIIFLATFSGDGTIYYAPELYKGLTVV